MDVMRIIYKMLAVFCLSMASYAANADQTPPKLPEPLSFIGKYYFSWGTFHLGDLELSIQEKPGHYDLRLAVTSSGMVNWFTRHESDTEVVGTRSDSHYQPVAYESRYKTKNKPRHIKLSFNKAGKIIEELNEPPENRALRAEVPANLKDGTYDPLTTLMVMRSGMLSFQAFDAKRLYQVTAAEAGEDNLSVLGDDIDVAHYILSRSPLAGLTDKEKKEYEGGEPPLHFYFSKDAKRIPVYMTMPIFMGSVKGTLVKECKVWDECKVN